MASVKSVGLSSPAGLAYAIQEKYLSNDPPNTSYTWNNYSNYDANYPSGIDELLTTSRCVIWSRRGVFRKCYNFDIEKETVTHALLTTFPSVGPLAGKQRNSVESKEGCDPREPAIVVFLKTQAHVYFLFGTSHVVYLPFEVESAFAGPTGVIMQRKLEMRIAKPPLKVQQTPQNSFVSPLPQPWTVTDSRHSSFSVADLGEVKQISIPSPNKKLFEPWVVNFDTNWPRLFCLSDPLSEIGLIVVQQPILERTEYKKVSLKTSHLDATEDLIYVSCEDDSGINNIAQSLVFALTWNRETYEYNVWKLSYSGERASMNDKIKVICRDVSRRRSSYAPATTTGATTPVLIGQQNVRDLNYPNNSKKLRKSIRVNGSRDKVIDFVSALEPEFENESIPRRKSRRVSSMLARADFSNSHERPTFSDLATGQQHVINRRSESLGNQQLRTSTVGFDTSSSTTFAHLSQNSQSFNGTMNLPVDDTVDEFHAEDGFQGLGFQGLEDGDFSTLKREIILTKIGTISPECSSTQYHGQKRETKNQCKVFTMAAPPCAADDSRGNSNLICIFDPKEKKLITIILYTKIDGLDNDHKKPKHMTSEKGITVVSLGPVLRTTDVLDACKIDDGLVSRILVLTEIENGQKELTLQAPWSITMKIPIPSVSLMRVTQHSKRKTEVKKPCTICGLRNPQPSGYVDLLDSEGNFHQFRIVLQPRNPHVCKILEICRELLPVPNDADPSLSNRVDGVLVCWWNVMQWLQSESIHVSDTEWVALTITLLVIAIGIDYGTHSSEKYVKKKMKKKNQPNSSHEKLKRSIGSWELMLAEETQWGYPYPSWTGNTGWTWLIDGGDVNESQTDDANSSYSVFDRYNNFRDSSLQKHVKLARQFANTSVGQSVMSECLPTCSNDSLESRIIYLQKILVGLHLLREEQKLDVMTSDCYNTGRVNLTVILAQIARWLRWPTWIEFYETEEASLFDSDFDNGQFSLKICLLLLTLVDTNPISSNVEESFECPCIYNWIQQCLNAKSSLPFVTIYHLISKNAAKSDKSVYNRCFRLTPRTLTLQRFFELVMVNWIPSQIVESFCYAGGDVHMLNTLPEFILVPLQEAIIYCQSEPPSTWNSTLLTLVGREDVNFSLTTGHKRFGAQPNCSTVSHESTMDVHRICVSLFEPEMTGAFSSTAEVDRQSVTRLIFKDDKRFNEAVQILDTISPTIAFCNAEPTWSESELLDAQKEHAQTLAYRTLAIPSGRGLLYYSSRIPLLTQKWNISGFNLNCIMKPENTVVTADKTAFTEEKVCWAFFHAGVAAGLQISRDAKGIDTSWILYNKPLPDLLNNRHAGFLLALGLNGHLKSLAKWVAFKYLTPKHTMTSIGLLLGLAVSCIGTMNTLITRLLSVHITRMLPPGAADLNLSPLTQTTGIMGIGILYFNTQHRRMSEIMLSEIENIETETNEEPLRNEGYRLAAGFALGFINLGKGSDLRGLHDMCLTERLLNIATGSKKVDLMHVLDKASAAAVMGIALIFMKTENQILARKIDIPDSVIQFDYVRPDLFLLRTVASHLIMWSRIEASFEWIQKNLPEFYRSHIKLTSIDFLTSKDLVLYNIIAGLCFVIALRFAGSADLTVRDLLIHYLDQLSRIFRLDAQNYDKKLTQNTVRKCQDLLALSVVTVMSGTGDIVVFRRLRSLHGRDDPETPYGSHLAAHTAIGALFLGGGTYTFGTSNLAIASLLVAFYPILPISVHDNKFHLQAFRHFWTLAAESRCFVTKEIDTNQPVSIPVRISLRKGYEVNRVSPCLLPELNQIKTVRTDTSDFWNLSLDLENNSTHIAVFKTTQTIYVRRRPAYNFASTPFQTSLLALSDAENSPSHPLEWIFSLSAFRFLTKAERALILPSTNTGGVSDQEIETRGTVIDSRLALENTMLNSGKKDRLLGLQILFNWVDRAVSENRDTQWIRKDVFERIKTQMWLTMKRITED